MGWWRCQWASLASGDVALFGLSLQHLYHRRCNTCITPVATLVPLPLQHLYHKKVFGCDTSSASREAFSLLPERWFCLYSWLLVPVCFLFLAFLLQLAADVSLSVYVDLAVDEGLHESVGVAEELVVVGNEFDEPLKLFELLFLIHRCWVKVFGAKVTLFLVKSETRRTKNLERWSYNRLSIWFFHSFGGFFTSFSYLCGLIATERHKKR